MKTLALVCGAALSLLSGPLLAQTPGRQRSAGGPDTYGVLQNSYYRIPAAEFTLVSTADGFLYNDEFIVDQTNNFRRYVSGSTGSFIASPHLPSGALIEYFELDYCDTDASAQVLANLYLCDNLGNCGSPAQQLTSGVSNNAGCFYVTVGFPATPLQVDNLHNQITVEVQTTSGTEATRFAGVILGYKLQVSPAPATSDFADVPTTHPFFQFIEALAASGITAGCGGGNYCPDAPLTRGQMAVFLAKALGLQFE